MSIENFGSITVAVSGGFFGGILLGHALKKVVRITTVVVGVNSKKQLQQHLQMH